MSFEFYMKISTSNPSSIPRLDKQYNYLYFVAFNLSSDLAEKYNKFDMLEFIKYTTKFVPTTASNK